MTTTETVKDESTGLELRISRRAIKRTLIAIGATVLLAALVLVSLTLLRSQSAFETFVSGDKYQAVFLTDGRVYFGHLRELDGGYYELRDVFYVQQPPEKDGEEQAPQIKPRSSDLHGPEGRMLLPQSAVSLIENIRDDAELAQTIDRLRRQD